MAVRLFDLFNAFVGSTQVVGAATFDGDEGFDQITSNSDGYAGEAEVDNDRWSATAALGCEDIFNFDDILALFEANDSLAIAAQGKLVGNIQQAYSATMNRGKLVSAQLTIMEGYAAATFNFVNSASSASVQPSDEFPVVNIASKTITHATGKRGFRVVSATYGGLTPLGVKGIIVNVQGVMVQTAGDDEFGKTSEVSGWQVTGSLVFQDETVAALQTMAQRLSVAALAPLVIVFRQAGGGSNGTLTLANARFGRNRRSMKARDFHGNTLAFRCKFNNGTTPYTLATGSNRVIAVA